jgi:hypothetical protein
LSSRNTFSPFEETYLIFNRQTDASETSIIMVTNATIDDTYAKLFDTGLEDIILKPYSEKIMSISKGLPVGLMRKRGSRNRRTLSHFDKGSQIQSGAGLFQEMSRQELKGQTAPTSSFPSAARIPNGPIIGTNQKFLRASMLSGNTFERKIPLGETMAISASSFRKQIRWVLKL